jgi:hypothetical protein
VVDLWQDAARHGQQILPRLGQANATAFFFPQGYAEAVFKAPNRMTYRRLGKVQAFRRSGQATGTIDFAEDFEVLEI